jgi:hypothetical protein
MEDMEQMRYERRGLLYVVLKVLHTITMIHGFFRETQVILDDSTCSGGIALKVSTFFLDDI